jgi:hypothetical protein
MKPGDLVRFWIPAIPSSRSVLGTIVAIRLDNLSITGRGEIYEVLTPVGVVSLTVGALELVTDDRETSHSGLS